GECSKAQNCDARRYKRSTANKRRYLIGNERAKLNHQHRQLSKVMKQGTTLFFADDHHVSTHCEEREQRRDDRNGDRSQYRLVRMILCRREISEQELDSEFENVTDKRQYQHDRRK